jgi:hypothetical protein
MTAHALHKRLFDTAIGWVPSITAARVVAARGSIVSPTTMTDDLPLDKTISSMLTELLRRYDEAVAERGPFRDLCARRPVFFGDPLTTMPAHVELMIMHMNADDEPGFVTQRFLSVRVTKSREHGFVSLSCLHGNKAELRARLHEEAANPEFLVQRVSELAQGLPEESNPDIWR